MRTTHYGLYAVLLLMLSVLLNVASPAGASALTWLDVSRLRSEGFDRLAAEAQHLREQAGSSDLVPALLVDTKGYRLGYGAGFYDRFLSTYPGKKICLAYQQNLSQTMLPHTAFDVAVDLVITESEVLTCA